MSSNVLQPNPPHKKLSFSKPIKNMFTVNTLLQPPKKSHLHHCLNSQKKHFSHRVMWASLGFLCLGQSFHRVNRKARTFLSLYLSLFLFIFLSLSTLILSSYYFLTISLSFFLLFKYPSFSLLSLFSVFPYFGLRCSSLNLIPVI